MLRHVNFFHAEVRSIDLAGKTVRVAHSERPARSRSPLRPVVIALGCTTNFFNLPGSKRRLHDEVAGRRHSAFAII